MLCASQRFEWVAPGVIPQVDNPDLQGMPYEAAGFGRWARVLGAGDVVAGTIADLPEEEGRFLTAQGIHAILVVPIFARDAWWGFMGFDDCAVARTWTLGEIDALNAAAGALGAAVERRSDPRREDLVEVRDAGRRAAALTQQLLAFSRRQVLKPELVDVRTVVEGWWPCSAGSSAAASRSRRGTPRPWRGSWRTRASWSRW